RRGPDQGRAAERPDRRAAGDRGGPAAGARDGVPRAGRICQGPRGQGPTGRPGQLGARMDDAMTAQSAPTPLTTTCPACDNVVGRSEQFCEACGAGLSPTVTAAEPSPEEPTLTEVSLTGIATRCPSCDGEVAADGYCGTCGAHAPRLRDHFSEQPAAWVAAVCDRGLRHTRNEDAVALAADAGPGSRAVLVVCDGVSSSVDSDLAALAAARAARDVLAASHSRGIG